MSPKKAKKKDTSMKKQKIKEITDAKVQLLPHDVHKTPCPPLQKPQPVEEPKALVPLKVFLSVFGKKPDQVAGFKYYATKNNLGPLEIKEWRAEYEKFMNKPTR